MLHRHASPAVAGAYTAGAVVGATISASALFVISGLLSPLPGQLRATITIGLLLLLVLHGAGVLCLDLPQRAYQIPRETFNDRPTKAAFRFALELGTGVRTYITTPAPYALAIVLVLCQPGTFTSAALGVTCAALGFGLGRARIVAAQAFHRRVAIDHPQVWVSVAGRISLALATVVAVVFAFGP